MVAGRLCLDQLRSARARYERPENVASARCHDVVDGADPADRVTLDDEVRTALLEVLRRLVPGERVSFVLHDVFGMPFDEIAETVGRPVGTCRQLARRARANSPLRTEARPTSPRPSTNSSPRSSSPRARTATWRHLAAVLDPDGMGRRHGARRPAPPPRSTTARTTWPQPAALPGPGATVVSGPAGEPVLLAFAERRLFAVVVLTIRDDLVIKIEATADPSAAARP